MSSVLQRGYIVFTLSTNVHIVSGFGVGPKCKRDLTRRGDDGVSCEAVPPVVGGDRSYWSCVAPERPSALRHPPRLWRAQRQEAAMIYDPV